MTRNAGRYSIQHISAAIRDFFKGWGKWGVGAVKETFLASKSCSLATPVEYTLAIEPSEGHACHSMYVSTSILHPIIVNSELKHMS